MNNSYHNLVFFSLFNLLLAGCAEPAGTPLFKANAEDALQQAPDVEAGSLNGVEESDVDTQIFSGKTDVMSGDVVDAESDASHGDSDVADALSEDTETVSSETDAEADGAGDSIADTSDGFDDGGDGTEDASPEPDSADEDSTDSESSDVDDAGAEGPFPCDPPLELAPVNSYASPFELKLFQASGGGGAYRFSFAEDEFGVELNGSGGIINLLTGAYLAGNTLEGEDVIVVRDETCLGEAFSTVSITPIFDVSPSKVVCVPGTSFQFLIVGGSGNTVYSMAENDSGGTLTDTGLYVAGNTLGPDLVRVDDIETGEVAYSEVIVTDAADLVASPELVGFTVGSKAELSISGGSSVYDVSIEDPDLVSWDGEFFEAASPGRTKALVTDVFTGETTWVHFDVVQSLEFPVARVGENQVNATIVEPGDINQDGYADVILGAWDVSMTGWKSGVVHVYAGGPDGTFTVARTFSGLNRLAEFGTSVAVADLNDDDLVDLVIGVPRGDYGFADNGALLVYLGEEDSFFAENPEIVFKGPEASARLGSAVALCDFNGDGRMDVAGGLRTMENPDNSLGGNNQGAVHIWLGYPDGFLETPDVIRYGGVPDGEGGWDTSKPLEVGFSMVAGDFTGDGLCDLAVSGLEYAPEGVTTAEHGVLLLYHGVAPDALTQGGLSEFPYRVLGGTSLGSASGQFGRFLATGDANADGVADLLVGQPYRRDWVTGTTTNMGAAHLFLSKPLPTPIPAEIVESDSESDWMAIGAKSGDRMGHWVAFKDLDGIPGDEVIVNEAWGEMAGEQSNTGLIHIYGIPEPAEEVGEEVVGGFELVERETYKGATAYEHFGFAFAFVGDQDGDGVEDMFTFSTRDDGLGFDVGRPYLVHRKSELPHVAFEFPGTASGKNFGYSVKLVPDLTGDGVEDALVGELYYGNASHGIKTGRVSLFAGDENGIQLNAVSDWSNFVGFSSGTLSGSNDSLGVDVSYAGDFNGDSLPDFVMVAQNGEHPTAINTTYFEEIGECGPSLSSQGAVYVVPGVAEGVPAPDPVTVGFGLLNDQILTASGGFDVNGDGYDDVVAGSYFSDMSATNTGQIYVLYGRPSTAGKVQFDCTVKNVDSFEGPETDSAFGRRIAHLGDLNSDGCEDFVVSGYLENNGSNNQGAIHVIYGWGGLECPSEPLQVVLGSKFANSQAGYGMDAGEDFDGDGLPDIVVGGFNSTVNGTNVGSVWFIPGSYLMNLPVEPLLDFSLPTEVHPFTSGAAVGTFRLDGKSIGGRFGRSVAFVPDAGTKGYAAIAVGSPTADSGGVKLAGGVSVFRAPFEDSFAGMETEPFAVFLGTQLSPNGQLGEDVSGGLVAGRPMVLIGEPYGSPLFAEDTAVEVGGVFAFDLTSVLSP